MHKHGNYEQKERKEEWQKLHQRYAPEALEAILELRGLYVKFGQSASVSPFTPKPYRAAFKQLQSDVPQVFT
jgi:aarF domain-containing kinase